MCFCTSEWRDTHICLAFARALRSSFLILLTALLVSPFCRECGQFRLVKVKIGIGIQKGIFSEIQI
jgi:hypothetical protein